MERRPADAAQGINTASPARVSSILASVGTPTTANYGATKAALETFSYALRRELQPYGVKVTVFVAPHTQTSMGEAAEFKGVRSCPPSWVAGELMRALDAMPRRYVARGVLRMGLRLAAWFPAYMESQLSAMVRHRLPHDATRS